MNPYASKSESFKKLNPHLFPVTAAQLLDQVDSDNKRLRQSAKPLMNKLEREWFEVLQHDFPGHPIKVQSIKLRIGNGCYFTPDFVVFHSNRQPTAWEVKGKHAWEDSLIKLKVAAATFQEILFFLVWKNAQGWQRQKILG